MNFSKFFRNVRKKFDRMNFWCYIVVENGREKDMFSSVPAAERDPYGARVLAAEG